jgi:hypothetical protein
MGGNWRGWLVAAVAIAAAAGCLPAGDGPAKRSAEVASREALRPLAPFAAHPATPVKRTASLFGIPVGEARSIVFISDRSGSMMDSIDYIKWELKRCIGDLREDQVFDVLFMSSGPPVEAPPRGLRPATKENKQRTAEFIDGILPPGETDPLKSIFRAFDLKPDVIVMLTDGEFESGLVDLVASLNEDGKTKVHTIGFLYTTGQAVLKRIAAENGGVYKFISEKDLETLSAE